LPKEVKLKDPSQFKLIGSEKKLPRLDSHAKSTGTQTFAIDVKLPDMMTAVVMRPPRFGAKVQSIDAAAAKAVPGVVDVVQIPPGGRRGSARHMVGEEGPRGIEGDLG
jgi:isoquinoline 1-oxidoreductase beta subunit